MRSGGSRARARLAGKAGVGKRRGGGGGEGSEGWTCSLEANSSTGRLPSCPPAGTYRSLWETYYRETEAVIFVVDSTDKIRMAVAKDELEALLKHADVKASGEGCRGERRAEGRRGPGARVSLLAARAIAASGGPCRCRSRRCSLTPHCLPALFVAPAGCPILFFANKMDLPGALEPADVMGMLGLAAIGDHAWHIQASNAVTGEGVDGGITWLAGQLSKPAAAAGKGAGGGGGSAAGGKAGGGGKGGGSSSSGSGSSGAGAATGGAGTTAAPASGSGAAAGAKR